MKYTGYIYIIENGYNCTTGGFIWKYIIERREFNEKL